MMIMMMILEPSNLHQFALICTHIHPSCDCGTLKTFTKLPELQKSQPINNGYIANNSFSDGCMNEYGHR